VAAQQKRKQSGISAGWVLQLKKTWHLDDCLTTQGEGTYIRPWFYVEWLGEEINRSRFHSSDAGWQDNRNFMYAPDIFKFGETGQVQLSCQYRQDDGKPFLQNISSGHNLSKFLPAKIISTLF
jgi:hypothetical protein